MTAKTGLKRYPKSFFLALVPFLLFSCGAFWQSDTNRAIDQARKGEYQAAAGVLERAVESGNIDPQVVESLYYSWIRQGEYSKAREKFEAWAAARPNAGPIRLAAGRIDNITGDYAQALSHLNAIQNFAGLSAAAQYEKARVLAETGKRNEATALYKGIVDAYQNGVYRRAADLFYVAKALWATEYFNDANDVFKVVTQSDPQNAEAFSAWGDLLLEKYQQPIAIDSYRDALKIDPQMPEAQLGLTKALALSDPEKSQQALDAVFKVNPNYPDARLELADELIGSEQYDNAETEISKAQQVNPQSAAAFTLLAAINYLRGNMGEFEKYVQKVLQTNPTYSDLYYTLADSCVSVRLYKEAVAFAREAIRINPNDYKSMSLLGVNLMRIGEEDEGKAMLEKAFEGDPFNVWTFNTLTLLDSFTNFEQFDTPHFHVKLHKKEAAPLKPYVSELLEKAYKELSAKYGFEPEYPISFEMFPDHADFAVRALGLPGLGALGVCFGKMFVMDSPSARKPDTFNWGSTLWHEFTHVITLQMTDHKIPRWFSEGLSVYEERHGFPGWGDDLKLEYLAAVKGKKLLPIAELNDGFIRPKYPEQVLVSYYQASIVADFIEQKQGFGAIKKMLALYKAGRSTEEVFKEAVGLDLKEFDKQFLAWVNDRTKAIDEKTFEALVSEGQQSLASGDADKAIDALTKAVEMYPEYTDEHNPYEPLADAYLKKGNKQAAIDILKKYMKYAETSFNSEVQLSDLLKEQGDLAGAQQWLQGAIYIRPLEFMAHEKLGTVLLTEKQYVPAEREYGVLLALDTPDKAGAYFHMAEAQFGAGNREGARKSILKSLEIAPSYEPAQELLLKIVGKK
jgi:tetratricopeptide (TPR) repeat protein